MNHILDRKDVDNISTLDDIFTTISDEYDDATITIVKYKPSGFELSELIHDLYKIVLSPPFIQSVIDSGKYHLQFGEPKYDELKIINRVNNFRFYKVDISHTNRGRSIHWVDLYSKVKNLIPLIKSYEFKPFSSIDTSFGILTKKFYIED